MSWEHESSTKYMGHYGIYFPGYVRAINTKLNLCIHDFAYKTDFSSSGNKEIWITVNIPTESKSQHAQHV